MNEFEKLARFIRLFLIILLSIELIMYLLTVVFGVLS